MKKLIGTILLGLLMTGQALAHLPNSRAPQFSGKTLKGKYLKLSDFKGKVVLLDFWASWCGPCKQEFPFLVKLHEKLKDKDFTVLAINVDTELDNAVAFLARQKTKPGFPIIYDKAGKLPALYKVGGMPTTVLIDKNGVVRYRQIGFKEDDAEKIYEKIKSIL